MIQIIDASSPAQLEEARSPMRSFVGWHRVRHAAHRAMRLDTGVLQVEAIGLYEKPRFQNVAPYHEPPKAMDGFLVFMEHSSNPDQPTRTDG